MYQVEYIIIISIMYQYVSILCTLLISVNVLRTDLPVQALSTSPIVYDADEINDDALIHPLVVDYY